MQCRFVHCIAAGPDPLVAVFAAGHSDHWSGSDNILVDVFLPLWVAEICFDGRIVRVWGCQLGPKYKY